MSGPAAGPAGHAPAGGAPDFVRLLWTYVIPAASIFGLLVYGMLRQLYAYFYGGLGASPEDVGLGYSETLALSGIAVLWVLALPPALVLLGLRLMPRLLLGRSAYHRLRQLAPPLMGVVLLIGVTLLVWGTVDATERARGGEAVTSVNIGPLQVLGLRAEPATVWWQAGREVGDPELTSGECLLYLGQSNGTTVLYDPGPPHVRTVRVQTPDVVVDVVRAERRPGRQGLTGGVRCQAHAVVFS